MNKLVGTFCRSSNLLLFSAVKFSRRFATFQRSTSRSVFHQRTLRFNKNIRLYSLNMDPSLHMLPNDQPVVVLECAPAFDALTNKEKLYAHYLSRASYYGGLIVLIQTSPESPLIFSLLYKLLKAQPLEQLKKLAIEQNNFSEEEFKALLVYTSGVLVNMGNYKGFGDVKFIPNLSQAKLEALLKSSLAYKQEPSLIQALWDGCRDAIYHLTEHSKQLGLGNKGVTTYFSKNCTLDDAELINKFFKEKSIEAYNTRLFKRSSSEGDGKSHYEVRLASVEKGPDGSGVVSGLGDHLFDGHKISVSRGDYTSLLNLVNQNLVKAKENALNDTQSNMLDEYIKSFRSGSLNAHIDGSRHWIKDKGPVIETYIGFIETYRDPSGARGEFEGFVAMVNKEMSAKFGELVSRAEEFLPELPWPNGLEKDKFLKPDFTSLDVLTFAGSGIPAGINIPNYDSVRQNEGFKNVSLGNVIPASYKDSNIMFLTQEDQDLMQKHRVVSFEVQVGLHELLGHGSGKLLYKNKDGTFNFDQATLRNPLTEQPISSWYEEGETYDTKFTTIGSSYEECRAECVGLYLSTNKEVLRIFGHEGEVADNVMYVNWLSLLWTGVRGLEMYQPSTGTWGQAHSQARYVIVRVLQEAGQGMVTVERTTGSDGQPDLLLKFDRSKLATVAKEAIGHFLLKLQSFKSTGDIAGATAMYNKYSQVAGTEFADFHSIVVARRQPRKMFVQSNTVLNQDGGVSLVNYKDTHEGLVQSWLDRFQGEDIESLLQDLWQQDKQHFL